MAKIVGRQALTEPPSPEPYRKIQRLSVKDFRALGYLQELNRNFLHPLGLALEVYQASDGDEYFSEIWDFRHDPEGLYYDAKMIDAQTARRIAAEQAEKQPVRVKKLGWNIQPEI